MELSTIEKNTEAQDIQSDAYDQRVRSVLIVPEHALKTPNKTNTYKITENKNVTKMIK